jgi:hypothetical protein
MRKIWSAGLGIALLGAGWWAGARHYAPGGSQPAASLAGGDSHHARGAAQGDTVAGGDEVAALRAQLRERDKVLGAMVLRDSLAQQAAAGTKASAAETKPSETPTERAIGELEQRLFAADSRPLEARDLQAAAEAATHELPNTVKATTACSSELCRVTIEGAEDQVDRNSGQLVERLPKRFAGTIVLPDGEGRRLVFAATRQEVLSLKDERSEK